MQSKILFVYFLPHPSHRGFAESVNADFWHYNHYLKNTPLPKIFKSSINGILLPKYEVYLTEGGAPISPIAMKKILGSRSVHINLIADETFMMMEQTPEEMKNIYSPFVNIAHKMASRYIDGAIAVSKMAKENAEQFIDKPIRIVYPFIEDSLYEQLGPVEPCIQDHIVLSIGYGKHAKGMDILIQAFKIVKEHVEDAEIYIIGKDHPEAWNRLDNVHVLGFVDDLIPYFSRSSVFVQSSRADTFPVATLESIRAGLPTIVSDKTGTKEVIHELGPEFVRKVQSEDIAEGILHYFELSTSKKMELSLKSKKLGAKFNKKEMCELFKKEFTSLIQMIDDN